MAGRIRDEDVALVRERARIDDVVREYVTLKTVSLPRRAITKFPRNPKSRHVVLLRLR